MRALCLTAQSRRAVCAAGIVCAVVFAPKIVDCAVGAESVSASDGAETAPLSAGLSDVGMTQSGAPELVRFEDELFSLEGFEDVRAAEEGTLVGFVISRPGDRAFAMVRDLLEVEGWVCVESGSETSASFVKQKGVYRWAFVSCTEVAGSTSVVVQCAR